MKYQCGLTRPRSSEEKERREEEKNEIVKHCSALAFNVASDDVLV